MAYSKQTWDTTSYVNPTRMNHIEVGIESASTATGTEYSSGVSVKDKIDEFANSVVAIYDFTTSDGRFYTRRFTTISRSRFPFIIFRIRQGGVVSNPSIVVGSVDNQGSSLVMGFSDSSVTFDSNTQTLTVDMLGSAWTYPVIFVKKGDLE